MDIQKILTTTTWRQTTVTSIATVVNGLLGVMFYFLLAKLLGSHGFGLFAIVATGGPLVASIFDFGVNEGLLKFIPRFKDNPTRRNLVLRMALIAKVVSGLTVTVIFMSLSRVIAYYLLSRPEAAMAVSLIGWVAASQLLLSFSLFSLQAQERFGVWSALLVGTNLARLLLAGWLFYLGRLTALSAGLLLVILPGAGFVLSLAFLPKFWERILPDPATQIAFWKFNRWMMANVIISAAASRWDVFLTVRLLGLSLAGVYSLAAQSVWILSQLAAATGAVMVPKFSSFSHPQVNLRYTLKACGLTAAMAIGVGVALVPIAMMVFKLAGQDYNQAAAPLGVLVAGMMIFLILAPVRDSLIYYFNRPAAFVFLNLSHLLILTAASFILTPRMGIMGPALATLVGHIFVSISSLVMYVKTYYQRSHPS